jgi:anionic cell wall polymer biosynthesis LytR-Cps2A-Psr (LCP) family protein
MNDNDKTRNNQPIGCEKIILISIIALFLVSVGVLIYSKCNKNTTEIEINDNQNNEQTVEQSNDLTENNDTEKNTNDAEICDDAIRLSEPYTIDNEAGSSKNSIFTGRRINISVTGLDGRIGHPSKLADANHVISILVETGEIEITSIPRDTYCDLGYESDSNGGVNLNKLTYARANKGQKRYQQELARIAKLDKIHYHIEFGFSQAMGIIEFLGYKNPGNTLQVLRSRKGLGGDDYQRCYSQGQFIRQAILGHFNKFTGTFGGLLARAGLLMVETNLTGSKAVEIIGDLEKAGFPKSPESVVVRIRPSMKMAYKVYDFSDEKTVSQLVKKIEDFNNTRFEKGLESPQTVVDVSKRLNDVLRSAVADSAKHPARVISKLTPYFEQRAWYQVKNKNERARIRNEFGTLLSNAYIKRNNKEEADKVLAIIEADKKIFEQQ